LEESGIGSNTENCLLTAHLARCWSSLPGSADQLFLTMPRNRFVNCLWGRALINLVMPQCRGLDQVVCCDLFQPRTCSSATAADCPHRCDTQTAPRTSEGQKAKWQRKRCSFQRHTTEGEPSKHGSKQPRIRKAA